MNIRRMLYVSIGALLIALTLSMAIAVPVTSVVAESATPVVEEQGYSLHGSAQRGNLCTDCIRHFVREQRSCDDEYEGARARRCRAIYDKYIEICLDEFCSK